MRHEIAPVVVCALMSLAVGARADAPMPHPPPPLDERRAIYPLATPPEGFVDVDLAPGWPVPIAHFRRPPAATGAVGVEVRVQRGGQPWAGRASSSSGFLRQAWHWWRGGPPPKPRDLRAGHARVFTTPRGRTAEWWERTSHRGPGGRERRTIITRIVETDAGWLHVSVVIAGWPPAAELASLRRTFLDEPLGAPRGRARP